MHAYICPPFFVPYLAVEPTPAISTGDDYEDLTPTREDNHDNHEDDEGSESEMYRVFSVKSST